MITRIILASLIFVSQSDCISWNIFSFEWAFGDALEKISTKIGSLPVPAKVVAGCVIAVGVVTGMYMAGKKDDKLPTVDRCPGAEYPYKKPKRWIEQELPREKGSGGYIDDRGDAWEYDPIKDEWDVQIRRPHHGWAAGDHINVNTDGDITHPKKPEVVKCDFSVGQRDARDHDVQCGTDKFLPKPVWKQ